VYLKSGQILDDLSFMSKVVVITGGSSGFGKALAKRLVSKGYSKSKKDIKLY
jgi:hypothetical protein